MRKPIRRRLRLNLWNARQAVRYSSWQSTARRRKSKVRIGAKRANRVARTSGARTPRTRLPGCCEHGSCGIDRSKRPHGSLLVLSFCNANRVSRPPNQPVKGTYGRFELMGPNRQCSPALRAINASQRRESCGTSTKRATWQKLRACLGTMNRSNHI
jgi:hypothetical protein